MWNSSGLPPFLCGTSQSFQEQRFEGLAAVDVPLVQVFPLASGVRL